MSWFRVDDGFWGHPKLEQVSLAAVGLWTIAGSWSARYATEGAIPETRIAKLGGTLEQADELVRASMWTRTDAGYQFHDWSAYQGSKEDRDEFRRKDRERKREERARKKIEESRDVRMDVQRTSGPCLDPTPTPTSPSEKSGDTPAATAPPAKRARKPRVADPDLATLRRVLSEEGERLGLVEVSLSPRVTAVVQRKVAQHAQRAHGGDFEAAAREIAASALADTSKPPHYALQDWQPRKLVPLRSARIEAFGGSQPSDWAGGPSVAEQMAQAKAEAERRAQKRAEMFGRVANG